MSKLVRVGSEYLINIDEVLSVRHYPNEKTTWIEFIVHGQANDVARTNITQTLTDPDGLLFDIIRSRYTN